MRKNYGDGKCRDPFFHRNTSPIVLGDAADAVQADLVAFGLGLFGKDGIGLMNQERIVFQSDGQCDGFGWVCVLANIGGKIVKDPAQLLHIKMA